MKKKMMRAAALSATIALLAVQTAFAGGSIGYGDISVYKGETLAGKLTGQNPVEDGSLLVCDGKCMLKSEGISLVAAADSKIAVENETDTFKLYVKEGSVDYVINNNARKVAFYTPQGTYTVAEVVFNADSSPVVKGKVVVDKEGKTEISVSEGRMIFATADGMKAVDANQKIVLAVVPPEAVGAGVLQGVLISGAFVAVALIGMGDGGDGTSGGTGGPPPEAPSPPPPPVAPVPPVSASPSS